MGFETFLTFSIPILLFVYLFYFVSIYFTGIIYPIRPYNAGPKSGFLRVALIRAGVNGAGVKSAIFERKTNILEKSSVLKTTHIIC